MARFLNSYIIQLERSSSFHCRMSKLKQLHNLSREIKVPSLFHATHLSPILCAVMPGSPSSFLPSSTRLPPSSFCTPPHPLFVGRGFFVVPQENDDPGRPHSSFFPTVFERSDIPGEEKPSKCWMVLAHS